MKLSFNDIWESKKPFERISIPYPNNPNRSRSFEDSVCFDNFHFTVKMWTNKIRIRCAGVTLEPRAFYYDKPPIIGIDWSMFMNKKFEARIESNNCEEVYIITGIYK